MINTIYVEKKIDNSWGKQTNMPAIEKLLQDNRIDLTPEKVDRMPDSYIADKDHGTVRSD